VLAKRVGNSGKPEYKIKWRSYPESEATWEPLAKLRQYSHMVDASEARQKKKADSDSDVQMMDKKDMSSEDEKPRKKAVVRQASSSSDSIPKRKIMKR
jgi:Chromo (CHRromatin Organisation MOdifier) domain